MSKDAMPEGPQVYRMAEKLRASLVNSVLESLSTSTVRDDDSESSSDRLLPLNSRSIHSRVDRVVTKGKRAVLVLDNSQGVLITFALAGKLEYFEGSSPPAASAATVAIMEFRHDGTRICVTLSDPQHLASVTLDKLVTILNTKMASGFDPMHTIIGMREWLATCKSHPGQLVANFITNQSIIAGVGNRYRSEIMYVARIPPDSRVRELTEDQLQQLLIAVYRVLKSASRGEYIFAVYGRKESLYEGEPVIRAEVAKGVLIWTTAKVVNSARRKKLNPEAFTKGQRSVSTDETEDSTLGQRFSPRDRTARL